MPLLVVEEEGREFRVRRARMADYAEALEAVLGLLSPGEVTTYGEVAKLFGVSPKLVGLLLKRNPRPIVVPCHRVVGEGHIGGYSAGGPEMKERLLRLESAGERRRLRRLSSELLSPGDSSRRMGPRPPR